MHHAVRVEEFQGCQELQTPVQHLLRLHIEEGGRGKEKVCSTHTLARCWMTLSFSHKVKVGTYVHMSRLPLSDSLRVLTSVASIDVSTKLTVHGPCRQIDCEQIHSLRGRNVLELVVD